MLVQVSFSESLVSKKPYCISDLSTCRFLTLFLKKTKKWKKRKEKKVLLEIEQCITQSIEMNSSPSLTKEIAFHLHFRRGDKVFVLKNSFSLSQTACSWCSGIAAISKQINITPPPKKKNTKPDFLTFYLL